ncbi:MAG: 50S ribosomal protein L23 [Patescibacteria group bacterium]
MKLIRPHITEKTALLSTKEAPTYAFVVSDSVNKSDIANEVLSVYKVKPTAVRVVRIPARNVVTRGHRGKTSGFKKAYVTLKKGDKIEFA